jgi:hypothetical protein
VFEAFPVDWERSKSISPVRVETRDGQFADVITPLTYS